MHSARGKQVKPTAASAASTTVCRQYVSLQTMFRAQQELRFKFSPKPPQETPGTASINSEAEDNTVQLDGSPDAHSPSNTRVPQLLVRQPCFLDNSPLSKHKLLRQLLSHSAELSFYHVWGHITIAVSASNSTSQRCHTLL